MKRILFFLWKIKKLSATESCKNLKTTEIKSKKLEITIAMQNKSNKSIFETPLEILVCFVDS